MASRNFVNNGSGNGLVPDGTKAITRTNINLLSLKYCGFHLMQFCEICSKHVFKITATYPGTNVLYVRDTSRWQPVTSGSFMYLAAWTIAEHTDDFTSRATNSKHRNKIPWESLTHLPWWHICQKSSIFRCQEVYRHKFKTTDPYMYKLTLE